MSNTSPVRILFAVCVSLALSYPASGEEGKTIFADDQKGTIKAMKGIVKAVGVSKKGSCLFCHVKEGGRPVFATDTPNKRIVRMMKSSFIDDLPTKGKIELDISESEHKTRIVAEYRTEGEDAGIHLTATLLTEHAEGEHGEGEHAEGEHSEGEHSEGEHSEGEHAEEEKAADESHEPRTFYGKVDLPAKGEPITCMTCHGGVLHFLSKAD